MIKVDRHVYCRHFNDESITYTYVFSGIELNLCNKCEKLLRAGILTQVSAENNTPRKQKITFDSHR